MERNSAVEIEECADRSAIARGPRMLWWSAAVVGGIWVLWSAGCDRNTTPDDEVVQSPESPDQPEALQQDGETESSGEETSADGDDGVDTGDETALEETEPSSDEMPQAGWREIDVEETCDGDWCRIVPDVDDVRYYGARRVSGETYLLGDSHLIRFDGAAWQALDAPAEMSFRQVRPISAHEVYAIGEERFQFVMGFDGDEWSTLRELTSFPGFFEAWSGGRLVVGGSELWHRDGTDWEDRGLADEHMGMSLAFGPDDILAFGTELSGQIWHFDGEGWEKQFDGDGVGRPSDVWAYGRDEIFVVGEPGSELAVHFDGQQWRRMEVPDSESPRPDEWLYGVWGSSPDEVVAVTNYGGIYHHDGASWQRQQSPVDSKLFDVTGFGADQVYAVGEEGVVLEYDGEQWRSMEHPAGDDLRVAWTAGEQTLFVLGREALYRFDL